MTDRRRVNGPPGGTAPPVFAFQVAVSNIPLAQSKGKSKGRTRGPNELRKIFLKTGLTPSASGSAYLELESSSRDTAGTTLLTNASSGLKLTCTVHGPRPLPRSAPFSPNLLLSTHIKFAPFAARQRRGYIRDTSERDLAVHLESALRGIIIGERWPKSGVEIVITVLEGEEDCSVDGESGGAGGWGLMSILSGCITVASAAITDAGIDCVDLVSGGVAAVVGPRSEKASAQLQIPASKYGLSTQIILDPCPSEHWELLAACVVGYLQSRDEITLIWTKGDLPHLLIGQGSDQGGVQILMDQAVEAAAAARLVLVEAVKESTELRMQKSHTNTDGGPAPQPEER